MAMAGKRRAQPRKIARSFYSWLPWHTKLLVPIVVVAGILFGVAWIAEQFMRLICASGGSSDPLLKGWIC